MSVQKIWVVAPGMQNTIQMRRMVVGRLTDYPEVQSLTIAKITRNGPRPRTLQIAVVALNRFLPRATKRELKLWMRRLLEVSHVRFENTPETSGTRATPDHRPMRLLRRVRKRGRRIFEHRLSGDQAA